MKNLNKVGKIWKRAGIIVAIVCVSFFGRTITSSAYETTNGNPNDPSAQTIMSGHIGDHAEYALYSNGDIFITGYGDMFDFDCEEYDDDPWPSPTPWTKYLNKLYDDADDDAYPKSVHIYIDADITSIGDYGFYSVINLDSVTFENGSKCKSIGVAAFGEDGSLKSIDIPSGVKKIGASAFCFTSLKSVTLPASLTSLGNCACQCCDSLTSVDLSKTKIKSMKYTFWSCDTLKTVLLPSTLKTIDTETFYGCGSLTSITIPANVTKIQKSAFEYTQKLKTITIKSKKLTSIGKNALQNSYRKLVIKVPASKYSAYKKLFTANTGFKSTMSIKKK